MEKLPFRRLKREAEKLIPFESDNIYYELTPSLTLHTAG